MTRVIAIDWSGAISLASSKIWLAEVHDGRLVRLEPGRDRDQVMAHLIRDTSADNDVVIGLDFAFSFPRWYAKQLGVTTIEELWHLVARQGAEWLSSCQHPFWGRAGRPKPNLPEHFRRTEKQASNRKGSNPKSVFQIGGAGTVGTGSIRGIPYLATLRAEGFSIWPFHKVQTPLVVEIYPRLFTGPVNKASANEREAYLAEHCPEVDHTLACKATRSEDAFDAAVSAVVMSRHLDEISTLTVSNDDTDLIEGRIWWHRELREGASKLPQGNKRRPNCPFCDIREERIVAKARHALAVEDQHPVSRGHTLVVPKVHTETLFTQSTYIQADVWSLVARVRSKLQSRFNPDGFNVGLNDGQAAGQTMEHAHIHIIPRFDDDVADPRGGIRWVLPKRAAYWDR